MDDQARQLRKLVQATRQAAECETGPPLFLVASPRQRSDATLFGTRLIESCRNCGIGAAPHDFYQAALTSPAWRVATLVGEFRAQHGELWERASLGWLLTPDDDASIVASYKLLKQASQATPLPPLELIVTAGEDPDAAHQAAKRLQQTCDQFLAGPTIRTAVTQSVDDFFDRYWESLIERLLAVAPLASTEVDIPLATHSAKQL